MVEFKIGDTVRLKSGGPLMTISGIGKDSSLTPNKDYWLCEWFDKTQKTHVQSFHKAMLKVDDNDIHIGSLI